MSFRIALVPGVNPDRWLRVWQERLADVPVELVHSSPADAVAHLRAGTADVALVRLPVVGDELSVIPLYTEATVVVVPKDHLVTAADVEIDAADLVDEILIVPLDDTLAWGSPPGAPFTGGTVDTTSDAVDLVAAGVGVLVVPQSIGRLHQRRGLTVRTVRDAPGSAIGLAWVTDRYDDLTEEFIGIVRGRTASSSRGRGAPPAEAPVKTKKPHAPRASSSKPRPATKGKPKPRRPR
ncbi:LysR family transcriptional regulator substrate-binding protein [Cellulomonas sp. URHE0023]|uniref:LysR family transcriptional regulator substrate-binding protein n=1 Tax=Cellulomonas sp. URHE0023 TaxID=1380354 RepID=UPI00054F0F80|nr:LysR family transcriptional regulator substrate-binding protein [Cellulomonas sp. URHE0023]